jgi:hypothetical protein
MGTLSEARNPRRDMMEPLTVLNDLRIASPCPASWAAMRGDDRVRYCDTSARQVYDISGYNRS